MNGPRWRIPLLACALLTALGHAEAGIVPYYFDRVTTFGSGADGWLAGHFSLDTSTNTIENFTITAVDTGIDGKQIEFQWTDQIAGAPPVSVSVSFDAATEERYITFDYTYDRSCARHCTAFLGLDFIDNVQIGPEQLILPGGGLYGGSQWFSLDAAGEYDKYGNVTGGSLFKVPEPGSLALAGVALAAAFGSRRRAARPALAEPG